MVQGGGVRFDDTLALIVDEDGNRHEVTAAEINDYLPDDVVELVAKTLDLPPSHVFEGLRALLAGGRMPVSELALAAALTAMHVLLAGWALRHVFARARRSGLLARYSAEGVG